MSQSDERRRGTRYECAGTAAVVVAGKSALLSGTLIELNRFGCLLALPDPEKLEDGVTVELRCQIAKRVLRLSGVVRAVRSMHRASVEFTAVPQEMDEQMEGLFAELKRRRGLHHKAASASAGPRKVHARKEIRYECAGTAEVKVADEDAPQFGAMFGALIELSNSGCLIAVQDSDHLPVGTPIHLLCKVGLRVFRACGITRNVRSISRVGVQFETVDAASEAQLKRLIGELSAKRRLCLSEDPAGMIVPA